MCVLIYNLNILYIYKYNHIFSTLSKAWCTSSVADFIGHHFIGHQWNIYIYTYIYSPKPGSLWPYVRFKPACNCHPLPLGGCQTNFAKPDQFLFTTFLWVALVASLVFIRWYFHSETWCFYLFQTYIPMFNWWRPRVVGIISFWKALEHMNLD